MSRSPAPSLLGVALLVDALVSGATGGVMSLGAGILDEILGLPLPLLRYAGLSLLPFAAVVGYVSRRPAPRAVVAVIAANVAWVIASVAILFTGWVDPTALGYAFVIGQAGIVALFAELQYVGLGRLTPRSA